jgi:hypothetical protein
MELLSADFKRVNHQIADSPDGACTNGAESFFSRLRWHSSSASNI